MSSVGLQVKGVLNQEVVFQEMRRCLQVDTRGRKGRGLNEWDQLLLESLFENKDHTRE